MAERSRWRLRRADGAAVAGVLLLAAGLTVWLTVQAAASGAIQVEVYQQGKLLRRCGLDEPQSFVVQGDFSNTVTIRDGRVAIEQSDCPGADCVHSGWISQAGRAIVCLPNRTEVRLVGGPEQDGIDMVVG